MVRGEELSPGDSTRHGIADDKIKKRGIIMEKLSAVKAHDMTRRSLAGSLGGDIKVVYDNLIA